MAMVWKQIYIESEQDVRLKRLVDQMGQYEAELIRQAINQYIQAPPAPRRDL